MPLRAVIIDREKLIEHNNWSEPLRTLLLSLYKFDTVVVDVSGLCQSEAALLGEGGGLPATEPTGIVLPLLNLEIPFSDCLVIADCEDTVLKARSWNAAVLGYEPSAAGRERPSLIHTCLDYLVEGFEEVDFDFLMRIYKRYHNLPWTVIETKRCCLREITMEDLDALYELYRPEPITRYMDGLNEEREKEEAYIKAYIHHMYRYWGYGLWVVIEKSTGKLIGRAGLSHLEVEDGTELELGYAIAIDYQGQGYATEVCRSILSYAKEALGAHKIYCLIHRDNRPSIRLAGKLGFQWEKNVISNGKEMQRYLKILHF